MLSVWKVKVDLTSGNTRKALDLALELSGHLRSIVHFDPAKASAANNDLCWGAFFASGKDIYLSALVDRMAGLSDRKSLMDFVTAASAQWSLASNALQHPRVKKYLEEREKNAPPAIQKAIEQALHEDPSVIQAGMTKVLKEEHQKGTW